MHQRLSSNGFKHYRNALSAIYNIHRTWYNVSFSISSACLLSNDIGLLGYVMFGLFRLDTYNDNEMWTPNYIENFRLKLIIL